MLGKLPAVLDHRTLRLERYTQLLPPPPSRAYFQQHVKDWPMYLNDQLGDCVIAAAGHMIQQWTQYAGKPFTPSNQDILTGYEIIGGYVPGRPDTDNGADMLTALNVWRQQGIAGRKVLAFAGCTSGIGVRQAVSLFGNCYIGLALPLTAQEQSGWFIDDTDPSAAAPGSWGGHCVPVVGYNEKGVTVVTWGGLLNASWNFLHRYCDEAYAVLSQDWIEGGGNAPSGFNQAQLLADLGSVTAVK